jgi:hypothetical protein
VRMDATLLALVLRESDIRDPAMCSL